MYRGVNFRIRSVAEIKEDLLMAKDYYGDWVKSVFFADGNTILMKTDQLVEILEYTKELFPKVERITMYGSAQYIALKTQEELNRINRAGLSRIHTGMESGDDEVLDLINKGTDSSKLIKAGVMVKNAGIELSEYIIVGVGGKKFTKQHALNSAKVLNEINPDFIRIRTIVPFPGTELYDMYKNGEFELLSPHEALREMKLFVENLNVTSYFYTDHVSNYCYANGKLPGAKNDIIDSIEKNLLIDESRFRKPYEGTL
jgi:radical SAM superfamily enzyme YgiQ (UPF0313 family)